MPGRLCFCACDSDSDSSSVHAKQQQQRGGGPRAIEAGLEIAKKNPPSPILEKTPPTSAEKSDKSEPSPPTSKPKTQPKTKTKKTSKRAMRRVAKPDEYLDYSSSTAVERLARDVETVLRRWHVVDGSDRHVSMYVRPKDQPASSPGATQKGRQPTSPQKNLLNPSQNSVHVLRSEQLSWKMSFYLPNGQHIFHSIDLEVALWDGEGNHPADEELQESLPLSLRRATGLQNMPLNVFANFATLFGIGQHITLTPLHVNLGKDLWEFLCFSIQQRHVKEAALPSVTSVLSGWLQSALNLATISSQCFIPAFGFWGPYQPQKQQFAHFLADDAASILPGWLQASQHMEVKEKNARRRRKKEVHLNRKYVPPFMTGQCLTPPVEDDDEKQVVFWASLLPHVSSARLAGADSRLTVWGNVLLRHCVDNFVALWGARHVYSWTRPTSSTQYSGFFMEDDTWDDKIWRKRQTEINEETDDAAKAYRKACQRYALQIMEEAADSSDNDPLWGPVQDPLASIHATVTWNATRPEKDNDLQPLLTLPLKIRSRHAMSRVDWIETEESIEHSILDPYRPSVFVVQVHGDSECAAATLTATQRCILAALIRTATLPAETMLNHLLDQQIIDGWDTKAGNEIAYQLAERIQAQPGTRALVTAMDWEDAADDMVGVEEAEEIVQRVLDSEIAHGYPERPEGDCGPIGPEVDDLFKPFPKAAPFGRLVSNLCVHMASARSPSSMVLVFSTFCRELRRRWDLRESLPNVNYVHGLDPATDSYVPKRCFSNVGDKATFAAQVNSTDPDPDDWNCLVGQKMQVFNLCVETAIAEELRKVEIAERSTKNEALSFQTPVKNEERPSQKPRLDSPDKEPTNGQNHHDTSETGLLKYNCDSNARAKDHESVMGDTKSADGDYMSVDQSLGLSATGRFNDNSSSVYVEQVVHQAASGPLNTKSKSLMSGAIDTLDWTSDADEESSRGSRGTPSRSSRTPPARGATTDDGTKSMTSQQSSYYDAEEGGKVPSIFQLIMGDAAAEPAAASVLEMFLGKDRNIERKGARCPVQAATLQNGEQVYAPYLRRPYPLTDDVIIQRRMMLARQASTKTAASTALEQLQIAHRFQFPKLSSDMSAFKAANPWASFEDFINWYGETKNPLEEYEEARSQDIRLGIASDETVQNSIAQTSESSNLMEVTKNFWKKTWESAAPKTAAENDPLFDPVSTAEMALHYLEALHPATLLCNVLAVNLAAAYFALVFSAEEALEIPSIRASLQILRKRVEIAINLLALDAVTSGQVSNPLHPGLSSIEAMVACETACIVLGENEVLLARGRSLLSKFPYKFILVDKILKATEGSVISVDDALERRDILRTVLSQQSDPTSTSSRPRPTLREYLLRNYDDDSPCQLVVRYGNHVKDLNGDGGLLMAVTKTQSQANIESNK
eukprot:scaffold5833_cov165-Amphora_coffeaeformis.AAC.10